MCLPTKGFSSSKGDSRESRSLSLVNDSRFDGRKHGLTDRDKASIFDFEDDAFGSHIIRW